MEKNLQKALLQAILEVVRPLTVIGSDQETVREFFHGLGWDVAELLGTSFSPLITVLSNVSQGLTNAEQALALGTTTSVTNFSALRAALQSTETLLDSVKQLGNLALSGNTANQFYTDVLQKLVTIYLLNNAGSFYCICAIAGVIEPDIVSITQNGKLVKYVSSVPIFSFDKLLDLLKDPTHRMATEYWPNGDSDFATISSTNAIAQRLLPQVVGLFNSLGIPAWQGGSSATSPLSADAVATLASTIHVAKNIRVPGGSIELGLGAGLLAVEQQGPGVRFPIG
jgi:hypothetical protein